MRRILYVGDPHATPEELNDCRNLIQYVIRVARENGPVHEVNFLGDQHHTHGVIRLEVVGFWKWAFGLLKKELPHSEVVVEVGNHDMLADHNSPLHSMVCYEGDPVVVVDRPTVRHGVLHMPYYHDREAFVRDCVDAGGGALVCHQTFDGSKYENGFPAKDGVDPEAIPQSDVLSGHIHTQQELVRGTRRVWYPGSPRWRTAADENVEKGVWLVDRDDTGAIVARKWFDTSLCCRARYSFRLTPDMPMHLAADTDQAIFMAVERGHHVTLDIEGAGDWVDKTLAEQPPGVLIRAVRVQEDAPVVRESEGIENSFWRFVEGFQPQYGTSPERLKALAKEVLSG